MDEYDVKRLALVLAVQAEIEGMKAANDGSKYFQREPDYHEGHFQEKAMELTNLAHMHRDQL